MSRRLFKLTNFRNIGLNGNSDNKIIINNSLERGKLGGIIELIGANNSGKSNVLDAIIEYGKNSLSDRDITTLSFNDVDRIPKVSLVYQDDNGVIEHTLTQKGKTELFEVKGYVEPELDIEQVKTALSNLSQIYTNYGWRNTKVKQLNDQIHADGKISETSFDLLKGIIL